MSHKHRHVTLLVFGHYLWFCFSLKLQNISFLRLVQIPFKSYPRDFCSWKLKCIKYIACNLTGLLRSIIQWAQYSVCLVLYFSLFLSASFHLSQFLRNSSFQFWLGLFINPCPSHICMVLPFFVLSSVLFGNSRKFNYILQHTHSNYGSSYHIIHIRKWLILRNSSRRAFGRWL